MLNSFDWLRRSRTGAELLATIRYLEREPDLFDVDEVGPPHSALDGPCQRCWVYPRQPASRRSTSDHAYFDRRAAPYCNACRKILSWARRLGKLSRQSLVIWARVNQLPKRLEAGDWSRDRHIRGTYTHDENHFLVMMRRYNLKPWLQDLLIYHGGDLRGLIQVLPTTGAGGGVDMADVMCRAVHHESLFPLGPLQVRFFSAPYQLLYPHTRDRQGLLTFEVSEFVNLLEMAAVFRTMMRPEAQQALQELLNLEDPSEEQFYWGRFLGYLGPEAKDMLSAWRIRAWPRERIQLLYELTDYVAFYSSD